MTVKHILFNFPSDWRDRLSKNVSELVEPGSEKQYWAGRISASAGEPEVCNVLFWPAPG